jgi:hypothetical protein
MKHLFLLLTIAALAGAASTDSLAFARFRADSTEAQHLWFQGDSLRAVLHWKGDSLQIFLHGRGQDHMDGASKRLSQDTARRGK